MKDDAFIHQLMQPAKPQTFKEFDEIPIRDDTTEQLLKELLLLLLRDRRRGRESAVYSGGGAGATDAILMDNTGQS